MKRTIICIILTAAILIGAAGTAVYTGKMTERLCGIGEEIIEAYENDEDSLPGVERFAEEWESYYRAMSMLENTGVLMSIDVSVSRLSALANTGSEELKAETQSICRQLEELHRRQLPHLSSLL